MCVKHLLLFFVISFASRGLSFRNGYSEETCDDLKPNREQNEPNVTAANSGSPFVIEVKSPRYRRNRILEVVIKGENIEGFQLQFRKYVRNYDGKPYRIGEFVEWPESTQPLPCDDGKNTAVTHKDLNPKNDLAFKWHAPEECDGEIKLHDAYVSSENVYWANVCDIKLNCDELPVTLKDCGEDKSCVRYSSNEKICDGNTCSYLLTYEASDNDVKFSLSALSNDSNSYSAVGFSETKDGKLDLTACMRENGEVSIKHYTRKTEKDPLIEETVNIQDEKTDKEGSNFWCLFTRPLKDAGESPLDFDKDLYWIYTWGKMNDTSHQPILGENWHQSESKFNASFLINMTHYTDGSMTTSVSGFLLVFLPLLLLTILQL